MCALNGLRPIVLVLATSFAVLGLCDTAVNTSDTAVNSSNTPDTVVGPPGAPRNKRLTTFGKSANMPSPSPPLSALRTPCNSDNECLEGAECIINPNATVNINQRMCYCMPGWLEVEGYCNGSSIESASILITLTFAVLLATYSQM